MSNKNNQKKNKNNQQKLKCSDKLCIVGSNWRVRCQTKQAEFPQCYQDIVTQNDMIEPLAQMWDWQLCECSSRATPPTSKALQDNSEFLCAVNSLYPSQRSCSVLPGAGSIPQLPPRISTGDKQDGLVWTSFPIKNQGTVGL